MSRDQAPTVRMVKLDPEVHEQINELAGWLGLEPGEVVAEAVAFYLDSSRDELSDRIQSRVAQLFEKAGSRKDVSWGSSAPDGWSLKGEIWGAKNDA